MSSKRNLIIIGGNGFDIASGMRTSDLFTGADGETTATTAEMGQAIITALEI